MQVASRPPAPILPPVPRPAAPLVAVDIPPELSAFQPVNTDTGSIGCADPQLLQQRAQRLRNQNIRLIAVRHGESEANAMGSTLSGSGDSPLSPEGRRQAAQAAQKIAEQLAEQALPVLIASPLSRAHDTARALVDLLQKTRPELPPLAIQLDPDLQEIDFGLCEGKNIGEVARTYPNFARGTDFLHRFPGGESGIEVMTRVNRFLDRIEQQYPGQTVVFFGHTMSVGISQMLLGQLSQDPQGQLFIDRSKIPNATPLNLVSESSDPSATPA